MKTLELTGGAGEEPDRGIVLNACSDQTQAEAEVAPGDAAAREDDVLDWDNLIAEAPKRPGGHIQVRLRKTRRDQPLPAEDPWAK